MAKQDNKTFTVAGTATNPDGTTKARFANDLVARIKILNKANCTNINLMELPEPMTKIDALKYLESTGNFTDDAAYAIASRAADKARVVKNREVKVTLKTGTASKSSVSSPKATKTKSVTAEALLQAANMREADPA
jgi:hypothetical protein